ncbi:asparagine synthase-related protein [Butyrivibrio fibrisolvens]|uniref:asparagine synthase-related protein n=1 Tax=Butyrivibrio fibrisolvens TaxID=831 RepID=UPI000406CCFE|nr:asparagine synthase-related protein [Butyrivibrio fibrisolvens]
MSAIWGCVDLSGTFVDPDIPDKMSECTKKYRIDQSQSVLFENVYMACGLQYITKESRYERLPIVQDDIFFTADVLLDNREELIKETLSQESSSDGELLFNAWKRWGEKFGDHVLGLYSFAIYDKRKNEFRLYTDHLSSRCIHYYESGSKVYFSTLTSSITDAVSDIDICDKWIRTSLSMDLAYCFLFDGLTPFEGIKILPYGTGIVVKKNERGIEVEKVRYYDPLSKIKENKKYDDEKCKEEFRTTFFKCVRDAIRTDGDCGILLSGGLDSTAVGSVAAKYLEKENKNLYSYTSVPLKKYVDENGRTNGYKIEDESKDVMMFCNHFPNIKPEFLSCDGENCLTHVDELCDYLELPFKSLINYVWLRDSFIMARKQGVKVILSGAYGNDTISFGYMENTLARLIKGFHFIEAYKQFMTFTKKEGIIKKRYSKRFLKEFISSFRKQEVIFDERGYKKEYLNKYDIESEWDKLFRGMTGNIRTRDAYQNSVFATGILQLTGIVNTKDGLYHGVVMRDPSMDKRMLELCLSLPYKCFAWNGVERRLVREYLKDFVPDEIRLNTRFRGRQSADAVFRLDLYGVKKVKKLSELVSDSLGKYYDLNLVKAEIDEPNDEDNIDWKAKIVSFGVFLSKYSAKKEGD